MKIEVIKLSNWRIPRQFIQAWLKAFEKELSKATSHRVNKMNLTVVFVSSSKMKSLNSSFRGKKKVTDILSFSGIESNDLGELVLCGEVIERQAKDHFLSNNQELGYLLIHGVLHLLGYEHEQGGAKAKKMFKLQDQIYDKLNEAFF